MRLATEARISAYHRPPRAIEGERGAALDELLWGPLRRHHNRAWHHTLSEACQSDAALFGMEIPAMPGISRSEAHQVRALLRHFRLPTIWQTLTPHPQSMEDELLDVPECMRAAAADGSLIAMTEPAAIEYAIAWGEDYRSLQVELHHLKVGKWPELTGRPRVSRSKDERTFSLLSNGAGWGCLVGMKIWQPWFGWQGTKMVVAGMQWLAPEA